MYQNEENIRIAFYIINGASKQLLE